MIKFPLYLSILFFILLQLTCICQSSANRRRTQKSLILVSTVDGKISALDTNDGEVIWSNDYGSAPLVSTSLAHIFLTQDGKEVEIVPSLHGGLFKLSGDSLEAIPFNADDLLEQSQTHGSSTSQLVGGKEYSRLGIDAYTGRMFYNCTPSQSACDQVNGGSKVQGDIIVVKRKQLTIRLVESRSGSEKWNFKVSEINLEFSEGPERQLLGYRPERVDTNVQPLSMDKTGKTCEFEGDTFCDEDIQKIKFNVPDATIMLHLSSDKNDGVKWQHTFDSHVTSAWVLLHGKLHPLDMWNPTVVPALLESQHEEPVDSNKFALYHGQFHSQSFVQLSPNMQEAIRALAHISSHQEELPSNPSNSLAKWDKPENKFYPRPSKSTSLVFDESTNVEKDNTPLNALERYTNQPKELEKVNGYYFGDDHLISQMIETSKQAPHSDNSHHVDFQSSRNDSMVEDDPETWISWLGATKFWSALAMCVIPFLYQICKKLLVLIPYIYQSLMKLHECKDDHTRKNSSTTPTAAFDDQTEKKKLMESNHECQHVVEREFYSRFYNDFEVSECLGKGGFGIVFRARHKLQDCSYAVKRILLPRSKRSREKVLREVHALAKLEHRSIVRFFDAWDESPPAGWQEEQDERFRRQCGRDWNTSMLSGLSEETFEESNVVYRRQSSLKLRIPHTNGTSGGDCALKIETTDSELSPTVAMPNFKQSTDDSFFHVTTQSNGDFDYTTSHHYDDVISSDDDDTFDCSSAGRLSVNYDFDDDDDSSSMGIVFDSKAYEQQQQQDNDDDGDDDVIFSREKSVSSLGSLRKRSHSECRSQLRMENEDGKSHHKSHRKSCHRRTSSFTVNHRSSKRRKRNRHSSCDDTQMYLYIQMQLCKRENLRDWLEVNKSPNRNHVECLNIFKQVVDAVIYIHSSNLIHRDLKPSNVFFSLDGVVKVGDFGLVTKAKEDHLADVSYSPRRYSVMSITHTQQVGTQLYMAPEQMTSKRYTDKVDIFALGLILFELSNPFETQMERAKLLNEARYGKFPDSFLTEYPKEVKLIGEMLSIEAHKRPSAVEIGSCPLFTDLK